MKFSVFIQSAIFAKIEKNIKGKIPSVLKEILNLTGFDTLAAIIEIEQFVEENINIEKRNNIERRKNL